MPIGGKLVLKGGETLKGVDKKKKKRKASEIPEGEQDEAKQQLQVDPKTGKLIDPSAVNVMSGKKYEQEFEFETKRMQEGKTRATPWGSTYRAPPTILHGYSKPVTGKTAEERLDLRCAAKSDKFCK